MNTLTSAEVWERLSRRILLAARVFDPRRRVRVFSSRDEPDALGRIYVINLDRRPDRWRRVRRELDRFRDLHGQPLTTLVRRISATDGRHLPADLESGDVRPRYTLADQLTVDPSPLFAIDAASEAHEIAMTRQEVAVTMSHIAAWRRVAAGTDAAALVLEDDVALLPGFASGIDAAWSSLRGRDDRPPFDLLYLAYRDVRTQPRTSKGPVARRREPGLWEAAAYVLTKAGASELLARLPVFGPVDLWLNLQFADLRTYVSVRPLIAQRVDEPSTNSYSVLPVLSQVGVITGEKALVPPARTLRGPVIGVGEPGSGLTALAEALSMVGYTCLSDVARVPGGELSRLRGGHRGRRFNAYVNIGELDSAALQEIADADPGARFVATSDPELLPPDRTLVLANKVPDRWEALSEFLGIEYPPFPFPNVGDIGQRPPADSPAPAFGATSRDRKFDRSPWILPTGPGGWSGVPLAERPIPRLAPPSLVWTAGDPLPASTWRRRVDTFPSNLAIFSEANVTQNSDGLSLIISHEPTPVRDFTAGAVCATRSHLYGTFAAELRPVDVSGLVTGLFLHRNGPRQEIDIEFLGRDPRRMLVNVFFNPGPEGTKLEYGYRGTPTAIDLGFNAARDFHLYEIDWSPESIVWRVDGVSVYRRYLWGPTPIPDRPLEFNVNVWHPRSREFAGRLDRSLLPASTVIRSMRINGMHSSGRGFAGSQTPPEARSSQESIPDSRETRRL